MSSINGKITAPITLSEVSNLLGTTKDVGAVCTSNNINKWSKYKPVYYYRSISPYTDTNWYRGKSNLYPDMNCCLAPNKSQNVSNMASAAATALKNVVGSGWDLVHPEGGADSPYRLVDFNGYYHYAVPPVEVTVPYKTIRLMTSSYLNVYFTAIDDSDNVLISDFNNPNSPYCLNGALFIACITNSDGTVIGTPVRSDNILESDGTLSDDTFTVSFDVSLLSLMQDNYKYRCYCGIIKPYGTSWTILPLFDTEGDNSGFFEFNVDKSSGISITNLQLAPTLQSTFRNWETCYEEGYSTYSMANYDGELCIKLTITNESGTYLSFSYTDFLLGIGSGLAKNPTRCSTSISGNRETIGLLRDETKTIYLYWDNILYGTTTGTSETNSVETTFKIKNQPTEIDGGSLYYRNTSVRGNENLSDWTTI